MPGMELTAQMPTGTPQDLHKGYDFIDTGAMGDCVSVIVGWNPNAKGYMANMRGFHGWGGLPNVNFKALFRGVDNNKSTQVWMISGSSNNYLKGSFGIEGNRARIHEEVQRAGLTEVRQIRCIHGVQQAQVNRFGVCTRR
ncbi:MAG: hypothetical protein JW955_25260 [Sedimentisphaerales bacterium]|nr:hypothetical protein [Sedimentisphaerales bacterium]